MPMYLQRTLIWACGWQVYDLAQLLTGVKTALSTSARALLVHDDIASHIAIMVESVKGIRKIDHMRKLESEVATTFCMQAEVYEDESGEAWQVLDCAKLLTAKQFVQSYL
jgi:twitching motility protein PilI